MKNLEKFNVALLGKWRWRLLKERGSLWGKVIESKYGAEGILGGNLSSTSASAWWRDVERVCLDEGGRD